MVLSSLANDVSRLRNNVGYYNEASYSFRLDLALATNYNREKVTSSISYITATAVVKPMWPLNPYHFLKYVRPSKPLYSVISSCGLKQSLEASFANNFVFICFYR